MQLKDNSYKKFRDALLLEWDQERAYHDYFGLKRCSKYIPRPYNIHKKLNRNQNVIDLFVPFLLLLWPVIFSLYICYQATKWMFRVNWGSKRSIEGDIYLSSGDPKNFNLISTKEKNFPKIDLTLPFRAYSTNDTKDLEKVNLLELTSALVIFKAAWLSIFYTFKLMLSRERRILLYTYPAFNWLWVYLVLREQSLNTIWINNHYDRWTGLADSIDGADVIMVQHGQIHFKNPAKGIEFFPDFRNKLTSVSRIFVLDDRSEHFFKQYIDAAGLTFSPIQKNQNVQPWRSNGESKLKILVVGSESQFEYHEVLLDEIIQKLGDRVDVAYKYHPRQQSRISNKDVWFLEGPDALPIADVAVSYGSSLDDEINSMIGCKILFFDPVTRENYTNKIIDDLSRLLNV